MNRRAKPAVSQRVISLLLLLTLSPLQAQAWQLRAGGGARTSIAPHRSFSNVAAPRPMSAPAPHSQPTEHPSGQGFHPSGQGPQSGSHPSGQGSQSGSHPSGQGSQSGSHPSGQGSQPPQHQQGNGSQPPPSNNNQGHNDGHHDDGHHDDSHNNDDHHDDGHHDDDHHDDHHDDGHHHDDDDWYHPWAAAAVVGATAIAIGTAVRTVPTSCIPVLVNGVSFMQCGSTWYQPQYVGTSLQYIVVVAPH